LQSTGFTEVVQQPRGFNVDPTGRYLVVAGQLSHTAGVYALDPKDGTLSKLHEYPMGKGPNWVEFVTLS
jgi:6-phosphogluconolactonase